jgi:hypothetical protein
MKHTKSDKTQIFGTDDHSTRGQSTFRNLQISWLASDEFGLTVANVRCGVCSMPLESFAVKIGQEVYLVCEDGHLVGGEGKPLKWGELSGRHHQFTKRHEYNKKVEELIKAFRETHAQAKA